MTSKAFGLAQLGNAYADGALSNRNKIINGAMTIDQRNAGAAVTGGDFPVDRFSVFNLTDGAFSAQQDTSAPANFVNSFKYTTTTADGTLTTTQTTGVVQHIEGYNVADFGFGKADAQTVTLSFWVRSSLTGTFGGVLRNGAADRSYPFSYSVSSADTWEYKTVTVAGDTSGTWLTTNGRGISVIFGLGAGPDRSGTAGAWVATNVIQPTVTGVQLEAGDTATPFEHRSYGAELALCQRYFQKLAPDTGVRRVFNMGLYVDGTFLRFLATYFQPMRAAPTLTFVGTVNSDYGVLSGGAVQTGFAVPGGEIITNTSMALQADKASHGLSITNPGTVFFVNSGNVGPYLSAEL
jgi:hypothetical protein